MNGAGQQVGTAQITATIAGVRIVVDGRGLTPGLHGLHIHGIGRCDGPAFTSAGGHLNPRGRRHGLFTQHGSHAGDLFALPVDASGNGWLDTTNGRATIASLTTPNGSALVIHADSDDQLTDPTGNSDGRVVYGVIAAQAVPPGTPAAGPAPARTGDGAPAKVERSALVAIAAIVTMLDASAPLLRRRIGRS